ncbi:DNA protecting protein DprA [Candidatus Azambacteria bacterium RIFCSPHIGHO2_01_FULL_44_55]|uniref:DNA protecting protein DprA n=1 Tax=Candidatus Azambacteria bacterium RIFCSPLOWO2_02_FULL_44_14 TaxID=1797306 RepID=A0A1F5CBD3_9BACT|nr:MAG: DNA protecting protein DprA [Candidatus Azambacteria bacterium RIFCSPLOWO2_01_FULL_44_84]OGD33063.1 MAG: DNA protecting protein DprA [Candidatus Azambacteria bacterium RIFCSPHIGHO2_02_FULL_45_18]OGD40154.1 MAG: DNA protecting protein DprA [Candidatus Azambacteria bacterium RIFCSPLOWO2_02_FULL_44_14]OGD41686.1 MAG: DNA protecting protein DprA [Candidatus Azambacteria bacterium RIFCSPHIGHO2_01_FULL_44_55]OGD49960.1 MAG: DNA protecting protein DprA [Candidatus Azambacteria bacterium RIFOXY
MRGKENFKIIKFTDKDYPFLLKETVLPPQLLYVRGSIEPRDKNAVAIVGARIATSEGLKNAYELAFQLAGAGVTIVSGLAQGIDTEAHKGALDAGGRTIAVLGTGVDVIYPTSNIKLAKRILDEDCGVIISEFSPGTPALPHHFPQRNRIISGLSLGTVVVEAREKSGALITANFALEQNRDVFAVPGPIGRPTSYGPNRLIKEGAKIVTDARDIMEELGFKIVTSDKQQVTGRFDNLAEDELKIATILANEPKTAEELIQENKITASQMNILISMLEIKGIIRKVGGKYTVK